MKIHKKGIPAILLVLSLPFYFVGVFSLRNNSGIKIVGSMRFWYIGLTGNYSPFQQYFYTRLANFVNAVVMLFILSIIFMLVYLSIIVESKKISSPKKLYSLLFAFDILSLGFYISGILFEWLFYSNKFHTCYIVQGEGRLGFGIVVGVLLHTAAFVFSYLNYLQYVLNPYLLTRQCKRESNALNNNLEPKAINAARTLEKTSIAANYGLEYYLFCDKGDYAGGKVELKDNQEIKIGKDPQHCAFVIGKNYKKVSRIHCGVLRKGNNFYVIDYSTNGTFLTVGNVKMQSGGILNKINTDQIFNLAQTENEFYCKIEKSK